MKKRSIDVSLSRVFAIALPMTIAYASEPLLGLVDTGVAGRLNNVSALAGLAIGAVMFDLIWGAFNFLRSSVVGLTAQAYGAGDDTQVDAVFVRALVVAIIGGAIVIALSPFIAAVGVWFFQADGALASTVTTYFVIRALSAPFALCNYVILGHFLGLGQSGKTLFLQLFMNITNMALSVLLGLVLNFAVAGIAMATVIGEVLAALIGLFLIWRAHGKRSWPDLSVLMDRNKLRIFFALNRDITIRSFCLILAFVIFTRIGNGLGETTLAANAVLMHVFLISAYLLDGFATAAEQMVGQSLGANDRKGFEKTISLTILCGYIFACVIFAGFFVFQDLFINLLVVDENIRNIARTFILWAAITPIIGVMAYQMDGVYIGAAWGREMRNSMLLALSIFIMISLLALAFGNNHILWLGHNVFLAVRGITLFVGLPYKLRMHFQET